MSLQLAFQSFFKRLSESSKCLMCGIKMNSRKNKCLSKGEKKRVIQAVEEGQVKKDVAKQFGISPSTLSMILKKKDCRKCVNCE